MSLLTKWALVFFALAFGAALFGYGNLAMSEPVTVTSRLVFFLLLGSAIILVGLSLTLYRSEEHQMHGDRFTVTPEKHHR